MYKSLAHPQLNGYVDPVSLEERLLHVQEAKKTLGTTIPWLVDGMDNALKHAMGDRPNSEFIIDPAGKVVRMRDWSSPELLRKDLAELVGPVENPTDPRSLNLAVAPPRTDVARGVAPRVQPESGMSPVKVQTERSTHPLYVKLRAEADESFRRTGRGKLYLGFFVDPIYHVHWNNQSGPVSLTVNGREILGPKIEAAADADPREFLVDVTGDKPVEVTLSYVACDDQETWCRRFEQTFTVSREVDRDAGRVMSSGRRRPSQQAPRRP